MSERERERERDRTRVRTPATDRKRTEMSAHGGPYAHVRITDKTWATTQRRLCQSHRMSLAIPGPQASAEYRRRNHGAEFHTITIRFNGFPTSSLRRASHYRLYFVSFAPPLGSSIAKERSMDLASYSGPAAEIKKKKSSI